VPVLVGGAEADGRQIRTLAHGAGDVLECLLVRQAADGALAAPAREMARAPLPPGVVGVAVT
jgi:hypothetical protein